MNDPETQAVREGEELDITSLRNFIANRIGTGDHAIEIEQFPAGSSNLTYLIRMGDDEFILRRPPFGNTVKSAHDMRREFDALSKLSKVYRPAPKPIQFCDDESIIGSEFYLMERRRGLIVRGTIRENHLRERVVSSRVLQREIVQAFINNLADLHSLDHRTAGLADFGKPEGYCRRQVEGWTKRYFSAKTHQHAELENAIDWLNDNIRSEFGASIIHNDYKFDNVMLDPEDLTKITAVLDWEMVTVGDPLMDLGTTLGYWMSEDAGDEMLNMPFNPRVLMENISRDDLIEMYAEVAGRELPDMLFYYVFGTFKVAVIAQQIYARYVKGFTKDERFADFDRFVASLGSIANSAIQKSQI